ncbi:MAG: CGNR zinc finger domain-containing protein [Stackebrandtia sp.]
MNFNSHTDAVVAVAVELVNALTSGYKRGLAFESPQGPDRKVAIVTVLAAHKRERPELTDTEADELQALMTRLRPVFEDVGAGDLDSAANRVNRLLHDTAAHPLLMRHDGEPWHLHFHGTGESYNNDWAAGMATGLAVVLGSEYHDRLGVCTAPSCDRVFVDTSRNGTRRFCSQPCQNRVKTAAFRAREKARQ